MSRQLFFHVHALAGGGAERVFARLASGFAARGDRVALIVERHSSEWGALIDPRIETIVLPPGHLVSMIALARLIRARRPDACLAALSASNLKLTLAATLAGRRRGVILSYHGFYENEPGLLSRLGYWLTPVICGMAGAAVAVSDSLRDNLVTRFAAPPDKLVTIYNPALPEPAPPPLSRAALAARPPMILGVGRLVPDKGFARLVRAFARIDAPEATLTILGVGPELDALIAEAERLGVSARVSFPGFADTDAYFAQARCFALASSFETFSLAVVEALAHGLAVVITDSGGPTEIVDRPELGQIVAVGDVDALAAALARALAEPGDPAPRQARAADFSLAAALDAYDALIARTIERSR